MKNAELRANPKNYREHPEHQRAVIRGLFEEIGYVDVLIARETPDGLELLDGHMRSEETDDEAEVPVLIVDLTDDECDTVIATLDPVGALAKSNDAMRRALLEKVETQNADLRRFLTDALAGTPDPSFVPEDDPSEELGEVPEMGLEPHEHYDYLVVLCTTAQEWNVLCDRLKLTPVEHRRGRMGTCRAIRAAQLLPHLLSDDSPAAR